VTHFASVLKLRKRKKGRQKQRKIQRMSRNTLRKENKNLYDERE
jgi:hypothetical protein